jgi:hypothetical protein
MLQSLRILLIILALAACASNIDQLIVTAGNQQQVETELMKSASLSDSDKREFMLGVYRYGYHPYGKSVGRIIADQRAYERTNQVRGLREIVGSWTCSDLMSARFRRFYITFHANNTETVTTTVPKPYKGSSAFYQFTFDGYTLTEEKSAQYFVAFSRGVMRMTEFSQYNAQDGDYPALPDQDIFTCRRAAQPFGKAVEQLISEARAHELAVAASRFADILGSWNCVDQFPDNTHFVMTFKSDHGEILLFDASKRPKKTLYHFDFSKLVLTEQNAIEGFQGAVTLSHDAMRVGEISRNGKYTGWVPHGDRFFCRRLTSVARVPSS